MAVYDPEDNQDDLNSLTPDELSGLEQKYSRRRDEIRDRLEERRSGSEDTGRGGMGRKLRLNSQGKEPSEEEALANRINKIGERINKGDDDGNLYNNGKGGKAGKTSKVSSAAGGLFKRRKLLAGVGGGVVGVVIAGALLFNFLQAFQLDNFFKFMEGKTNARLSASLDTRNRHLVKAYMKIRAQEIEGKTENDNLYFKADKVDTNKPLSDWYRTMRKSKFEKQLLENQGIQFVSMVDSDGKVNVAKIVNNDTGINPSSPLASKLTAINADGSNLTDVLNSLSPEEMDQAFTVDKLGSHKAARKSVREAVNSEVPWYRTFKRRHLRKDIANVTGIKEWRLFEQTRDKIAKNNQERKDKLLNKIVDRYYKNSPAKAQLMKCLFSDARCSNNSDPSSPDAKTEEAKTGVKAGTDEQATVGEDGSTVTEDLPTGEIGDELEDVIEKEITEKVVEEGAEEVVEEAAELGLRQRIIAGIVRNLSKDAINAAIPYNPLVVWTWAKRITKVDTMIGEGSLSKLVTNSRRSYAIGLATTWMIGNDQMKSGQLVGDELNDFFDMTKNLGNTEGWAVATGQMSAATAANSKKRADYCKLDVSERKVDDFAWQCDDEKIGGSSTAKSLEESYESTIGPQVGTLADGVRGVEESWPGKVADAVEGWVDERLSAILNPIFERVLNIPWVKQTISDVMALLIEQSMKFLGGAPPYDPSGKQPGLSNFMTAGLAAMAESSTRASGGIASTPASLEYSNKLAVDYTAEQNSKLSTYDRYASLNNPESFASSALFASANNTSLNGTMAKFSNTLSSLPKMLGNIFSGRAFALEEVNSSTMADWAGVEKYDIPRVCIELDPLDAQYQQKATNAAAILANNGISDFKTDLDTMRDTDKFWNAVYTAIGEKENAQEIAAPIYNCALLDARVMGNLGGVYGYKDDNGYGESGGTAETTTGVTGILAPGALAWPGKTPATIYDCFGTRGGKHMGIDIGAGAGTPIFASAAGTVTHVQNVTGYGPHFVAIEHDNGFGTSYGHMSKALVKVGDVVTQGQQIGEEGNEGRSDGSHLHFNVFPGSYSGWDTPNVDPFKNGLVVPEGVTNRAGCTLPS